MAAHTIANKIEWVNPRWPNMERYSIPKSNVMTSRSGTMEQSAPAKINGGVAISAGRKTESASGTAGWVITVHTNLSSHG